MMKRMKKFIGLLLSCAMTFMALTACVGCSFGEKGVDVEVQIDHGTRTEIVVFDTGGYASDVKLTPNYIEDKILLGYYDTQDDNGRMYFDFLGRSTTRGWSELYPTKLYAVYETCDNSKVYRSEIKRDENPYNPGYQWGGGFFSFEFLGCSIAAIKHAETNEKYTARYAELAQFVHSNGDKKVKLTMYFSVKQVCSCCDLGLNYRIKVGSEALDLNNRTMSQQWQQVSISTEIYAKQLRGSTDSVNYISLQMNPDSQPHLSSLYSIKNVYYTIQAVD